jgi:hypothetical protein
MLRTLTCLIFGAAICLFGLTAWAAMAHQGGSAYFPDVSASSPHNHDIGYLYESGIVNGFGDGTYAPGVAVTRDQMASYIVRAQMITYVLTMLSMDHNYFGGYYTGEQAYLDGRISYEDYQAALGALLWATEFGSYEFDQMRNTDMERVWNLYF